ncbi:GtrA family protein [Roseitalea sp. MMSF_3516]|nr:GtrA family protein [Roseitalea sp. MMSF_3516]
MAHAPGRGDADRGGRPRAATTPLGRLCSFAAAGGSGFVIDFGVLYLMLAFTPLGPFAGRLVSIACAMVSNFLINRTFTFGASGRSILTEGARYSSIAALGAGLNYVVYAGLLLAMPGFSPFWATFIAVALVSVFSYLGYARFVFRR